MTCAHAGHSGARAKTSRQWILGSKGRSRSVGYLRPGGFHDDPLSKSLGHP